MSRAALEKYFINGRLITVIAHKVNELPPRRVVGAECLDCVAGTLWYFPGGGIANCGVVNEGDVLVVRWVWADAPHYVKRDGRWWEFESRKACRDWRVAMSKGWVPPTVPREVSFDCRDAYFD